jgi:uncharacterized protein (TIGR02996 family)
MNDHDALLAAVLARHEEDTPRLVLADWLEENGRAEWAEFIRAEVELARLGVDPDRHAHLTARCRALRPHLGVRLPAPGGRWLIPELAQFARGFVEHVTYTAADWLAVADSLHWHPAQATECTACEGRGWTTGPTGCPACRPGWAFADSAPSPAPARRRPSRCGG